MRAPGVRLDPGGIAKGMAADLAAAALPAGVRYAISCGGDVAVGGGEPWEVAVRSARSDAEVHRLRVRSGGVATSGIAARIWQRPDGSYAHHVLDPATGRPAWTGLVAATAVADSALEAEVLAKTALLSGPLARGGCCAAAAACSSTTTGASRSSPRPPSSGFRGRGRRAVVAARRRRRRGCRRRPSARPAVATQRPCERLTVASTRVRPLRRPEKPPTRSKLVERVTLMRIVPRSESWRRNAAGVAIDGHHGALVLTRGRRGDTGRERRGRR